MATQQINAVLSPRDVVVEAVCDAFVGFVQAESTAQATVVTFFWWPD